LQSAGFNDDHHSQVVERFIIARLVPKACMVFSPLSMSESPASLTDAVMYMHQQVSPGGILVGEPPMLDPGDDGELDEIVYAEKSVVIERRSRVFTGAAPARSEPKEVRERSEEEGALPPRL
jgi:hypothetical protein